MNSASNRTGWPTEKHRDLVAALSRVLRAVLLAERERLLPEIDMGDWGWSAQLSGRLDVLDEALTRLGYSTWQRQHE